MRPEVEGAREVGGEVRGMLRSSAASLASSLGASIQREVGVLVPGGLCKKIFLPPVLYEVWGSGSTPEESRVESA